MELRDAILEQVNHHETHPVPFSLGFEGDVAERLDAHYGGPEWREKLLPYLAHASAVETWPTEEIAPGRIRDAYGTVWRTDRRPWHLESPAIEKPSFDGYDFPEPQRFARSAEDLSAAREACREHADRFRIAGIGWGLFERSWTIRGFENALTDAIAEPDFYAELLDRITDLYSTFVAETVKLPVDAVMFGDDWGDQRGVILGPRRWRDLLKPRWARLYEQVHAAGKLVISHCCGNVTDIMPDIIEIGLDVLESCQPEAMDVYELKRTYGPNITFWGGLGTQRLTPFGTPEEIHREVTRLCTEMGRGGGYLLAPAKGLQPETPTENAVAVFEAFTNQAG
ncbi:MAG TPA: uroporphyrinogen decarboxylase family protein [Planctomycetota bacterium]|nr:uroporphyrinogen decarboxylase family protein [Planctomycetota bacterium]